jgi:hypothetical protein
MIFDYEEQLLELIDTRIATASNDELFAGGYLRGHISLSAARCDENGMSSFADLKVMIENSIDEARSELSPADRVIVSGLWQELCQQAGG